ncbi:hypothetical protein FZC83_01750 [Rossellomorea marisflavi]|uniref:Uncharacterized protein n=1 Tax=Rossellomorea marisflavi TaxID=189381 RepID=A0A5D4S060_9BACI|nr:hypothetical protein [Rossellomorea marisflavi]TYS56319.1 hypothetical protein FZC83_01750 [Rossellomorea marisflavi]
MTANILIKRFMDEDLIILSGIKHVEMDDQYITFYGEKCLIIGQFKREFVIGHYLTKEASG